MCTMLYCLLFKVENNRSRNACLYFIFINVNMQLTSEQALVMKSILWWNYLANFLKNLRLCINTAGLHENSAIREKTKLLLSFLCCSTRNVIYVTINLFHPY